ncbi:hypothetical protein SAMN05518847_105231 [Paenibacillus sp. OV219]|nr:hypothetical protein SAMN05518847_105231 [Paenibacillus sp. OV219]
MMNIVMYSLLVAILYWVQLKLMKKMARTRDYVVVGLILTLTTIVGICLAMGIQLTSPTMILQKWILDVVK